MRTGPIGGCQCCASDSQADHTPSPAGTTQAVQLKARSAGACNVILQLTAEVCWWCQCQHNIQHIIKHGVDSANSGAISTKIDCHTRCLDNCTTSSGIITAQSVIYKHSHNYATRFMLVHAILSGEANTTSLRSTYFAPCSTTLPSCSRHLSSPCRCSSARPTAGRTLATTRPRGPAQQHVQK